MKNFITKAKHTAKNILELPNLPVELKIKKMRKELGMIEGLDGWMTGNETGAGYLAVCKLAATTDLFDVFRRSRDYRAIVDTVTKKQGQQYFDLIKDSDLLRYTSRFATSDTIGDPVKYRYPIGSFSPTTIRYIKFLIDLRNAFGPLDGFDIVEIGGGYGGLCKIISDIYRFNSYTIADLPAALAVTRRYLDALKVPNVSFEPQAGKNYDLAISNYALTELGRTVQDGYIEKLLKGAKRGYIIYTYDGPASPEAAYNKKEIIDILSRYHEIKISEQHPHIRGANEAHFTIMWGGKNIQT